MYIKNKKQIISFSKMHGLGNDFMVVNNIKNNLYFSISLIKKLSDRKYGIGFDQLLLIEHSYIKKIDFFYRIFNSNGIEVSQCGNGVRCIAYYLIFKKIIQKKNISIQTNTKIMHIEILNSNNIIVNMGKPIFEPKKIPFLYNIQKIKYNMIIQKKKIYFGVVSIGNPHCVIEVNNFENNKVHCLGKIITSYYLFPEQINVGFMKIINNKNIFLRVYERHVGETNACGSAACAAVAVGILQNKLSNNVKVNLLGGSLKIYWNGLNSNLYMKGPAVHVYDGIINI